MPKLHRLASAVFSLILTGCTVYTSPRPAPPPPPPPEPAPVAVVSGPGVELISVEPVYADRVYVYDPGYPPGTYFWGNYYYYNGYRYPHDVFVNQYVVVNVREHRFYDAADNRRRGMVIAERQRVDYARNGGRPAAAGGGHPGPSVVQHAPAPQPARAPAPKRR
jgi:hypothetical protein